MDHDDERELESIIKHLTYYATARNRNVDTETRTITITDDDALLILRKLVELYGEGQ